MKIDELAGKYAVRVKGVEYTTVEGKVGTDNSYTFEPVKVLEAKHSVVIVQTTYDSDPKILSCRYHDENWEEVNPEYAEKMFVNK